MVLCSGIAPSIRKNYVAPERQETFLRFLRAHKLNVTAACRSTGLAGTGGVYLQRRCDEDFRQRWEQVEDEFLDQLEEHQFRAAGENSADRRWTLRRRRPVRWTESKQFDTQTDVAPDAAGLSDEELMIVRGGGQLTVCGVGVPCDYAAPTGHTTQMRDT